MRLYIPSIHYTFSWLSGVIHETAQSNKAIPAVSQECNGCMDQGLIQGGGGGGGG